jgi:hypothetical protein
MSAKGYAIVRLLPAELYAPLCYASLPRADRLPPPSHPLQHDSSKYDDFKLIDYPLKSEGEYDIDISIEHCGICASDLHTIKGAAGWGEVELPVRIAPRR